QVYSASYAILRPQREAGRITVLAQTGRERAPSLPDIPTGIEAGFPELEMDGNVGLFGSKALSAKLRERIGADVVAVSNDKAIDDKLRDRADAGSRRSKGVRRLDRAPARPDRHHRQGARHPADAIAGHGPS